MDHRGETDQLGPMKSYCIPTCSGPGQGDGGLDPGSDSENEKCSESLRVSQIILARLADPQEVGWEGNTQEGRMRKESQFYTQIHTDG